ncbi:CatB-related O-acetyltransferase [Microvirga antarctica]|uniref:CatB-related O-acetyltransferase n=1 Tax=Microvirga antarctica TaxID=2819233 RepID=UPI001B31417D|nr:CatB-related O-acetyltransferase [Microvirga antarctica]
MRENLAAHGLYLAGQSSGRLIWESPVRIFHAVYVTDVEIGAYSYVGPESEICRTTIGRYCSLGNGLQLFGSDHPRTWLSSHPFAHRNIFTEQMDYAPRLTFDDEPKQSTIGNDVWIGSRVTILPGVRIGNGAVIGAGCVVVRDVPDYAVLVGNPGRVAKYRFGEALIERLLRVQWWRFDLPQAMIKRPDLPLDDPERMLDVIESNEADFLLIQGRRKMLSRQSDVPSQSESNAG